MNSRRSFLKTVIIFSPGLALHKSIIGSGIDLPNVLILGDSISIGYTPFVKEILLNEANIVRPVYDDGKPENCEGTTKGVKEINRWIGDTKWDVIHFNFGLHDIKHVDPKTGKNSNNPNHPHQAGLKHYKKNLEKIVEVLKSTGAKLIFATTTPYPDHVENPLRKPGMAEKYNKAALKIMYKNGIAINDLYTFMKPRMNYLQLPHNVHFTEAGYKALSIKVADRIREALEE